MGTICKRQKLQETDTALHQWWEKPGTYRILSAQPAKRLYKHKRGDDERGYFTAYA